MKRTISVLLIFTVLLTSLAFALPTMAQSSDFAGGDGSTQEPYLISNKNHLDNVREYPDAHFKMICDIIFKDSDFRSGGAFYNGSKGWLPIENFNGSFDGNGYCIENLYISTDEKYAALFATNSGTIKRLGITGDIYAAETSTGYIGSVAASNHGRIENCFSEASITVNVSSGSMYASFVGGICGYNSQTVKNCYNTGSISGNNAGVRIGGIVGIHSLGSIQQCYNSGELSVGAGYVGGVVYKNDATVDGCFCFDDVQNSSVSGSGTDNTTFLSREKTYTEDDFSGFDFEKTWYMPVRGGYSLPKLSAPRHAVYTIENDSSYPFDFSDKSYTSVNKSNNTRSQMKMIANFTGTMYIDYSVSSESDYDKFIITRNGSSVLNVSGIYSSSKTLQVYSGDEIIFSYSKDGSVSNGSDSATFSFDICTNSATCCDCGQSAVFHDFVDHEGKQPTCLEGGWADYRTCTNCDYSDYQSLPISDHSYVYHDEKAPTCAEVGWQAYKTCSVCDYTTYSEIAKLAHTIHTVQNDSANPFTLANGVYTSTNKTDRSSASVVVTVAYAGKLTFSYSVSSEPSYDKLKVYHNGTETYAFSGSENGFKSIIVSKGDKITFTYSKDGTVSKGSDSASFKITSEAVTTSQCTDDVCCVVCNQVAYPSTHQYTYSCTAECELCGQERDVTHTYTNSCDESCNICGFERAAGHVYDNSCDTTCNVCSHTRTITHTYDNSCDTECNVCGNTRSITHTFVHHNAQEPTCSEVGWNAYDECSVCGYSTYQEIEKTSHSVYTSANDSRYPFSLQDGTYTSTNKSDSSSSYYTITSGFEGSMYISYTVSSENNYDYFRVLVNGNDQYHYSGSKTGTVTLEVEKGDVIKLGYTKDTSRASGSDSASFSFEICSDDATCRFCSQNVSVHKYVRFPGKEPTCTESGYSEYRSCSRCKKNDYQSIPSTGHDYQYHQGQEPTCLEGGYADYQTCSRCDYSSYQTLSALGHNIGHFSAKAPTCTDSGWEEYDYCYRCGDTTYESIPAIGHRFYTVSDGSSFEFHNGWYTSTNFYSPSESRVVFEMQFTGEIRISYDVSSESGFDEFIIYLNSDEILEASGENQDVLDVSVEKGDLLTFLYTKDGSGSEGDDRATFFVESQTPDSNVCSDEIYCQECYDVIYEQTHQFDYVCDPDCNECGLTRPVVHTYSHDCDESCNVCGRTRTVYHLYTNDCDDSCNRCGFTRIAAEHIYDNVCDESCNECGAERTASHSYSSACDKSCDLCGYERTAVEHVYYNACDRTCNVCGYIRSSNGHVYDNGCDSSCNVCGYTRQVSSHIYDNGCDSSCNECGASRSVQHTYSNGCDTSCNSCGAVRTVAGHSYTNSCDGECNSCGAKRNASHKFGEYRFNYDSTTAKDGTKSRTCSVCKGKETVTAPGTKLTDTSRKFKDVPAKAWYKSNVDFAVSNGIFGGKSANTFEPDANITRAEFVQVLANISKVNTTNKNVKTKFADVKSGQWYTPAVKWASDNGIVSGKSATTFEPNAKITREEMCVMLVNYANFCKINLAMKKNKASFADDRKISSWAKERVYLCQRAGLVNGKGANNFDPQGNAIRAEVATIFALFYKDYM